MRAARARPESPPSALPLTAELAGFEKLIRMARGQ
jgi:hypothetical protein